MPYADSPSADNLQAGEEEAAEAKSDLASTTESKAEVDARLDQVEDTRDDLRGELRGATVRIEDLEAENATLVEENATRNPISTTRRREARTPRSNGRSSRWTWSPRAERFEVIDAEWAVRDLNPRPPARHGRA
jgi:hypothetical protein